MSAVAHNCTVHRPFNASEVRLRTEQFPLAVQLVRIDVDLVVHRREVDLAAVVSPRTELHRAVLVVERKPRDVDWTRRDVEAEWNPRTRSV